jgi:hypothetical protein
MKKNKLFLIVFAIMGLIVSCDDAINIRQDGEVNDPSLVYNTVEDLQRGLNGVYAVFSTGNTIEFNAIFTDEVSIGLENGGQGLNDGLYNFQLNAGSGIASGIWGSNYTLINFTNRILAQAPRVREQLVLPENPTQQDEEAYAEAEANYGWILGQLHAIRAFATFQLLTYYSENLKDDSALGVIILDFVPDNKYDTYLPRSTNAECFAFIQEDLAKADELLDPTTYPTRVSPVFVTALRARMAAYRGRYTEVLPYANSLISQFPLATKATYPTIWTDTGLDEVIFKLARVNGDAQVGAYFASVNSSISGSPFYEVSRSLYNLYAAGDVRGGTSLVDPTSIISTNPAATPDYKNEDVLVINKYPGNTAQGDQLLNDIKVFRVAEMYLLKAEALAAAGNLNGAGSNSVAGVLRLLRNARYGAAQPLPVFADATAAWAEILLERRKELAFEGFRYVDIKRLGVLAGNKGVERYDRDCQQYNACTLAPTDFRFIMPIPTTELTANPNIRGQQNPGY